MKFKCRVEMKILTYRWYVYVDILLDEKLRTSKFCHRTAFIIDMRLCYTTTFQNIKHITSVEFSR